MSPKQRAIARAKELGVTLFKNEVRSGMFTVEVDAPTGKVFIGEGLHMMVCDGWKDAISRMSGGLEDCDNPECETCECSTLPEKPMPTNHNEFMAPHDGTPEGYAAWMGWELIYSPNMKQPV